jgi:chromate transport protein ChrA
VGVKPVVVAMIAAAVFRLGKTAAKKIASLMAIAANELIDELTSSSFLAAGRMNGLLDSSASYWRF